MVAVGRRYLTIPVAGLTLLAACGGCQQGVAPARSAGGDVSGKLVEASIVNASHTTLKRTTTQPATVAAFYQAELYAKAAGYLSELHVDIGAKVEADQVLARIAVPEMEKACEKQQATIRRLEADQRRAEAAKKLAHAEVEAARAIRDQSQADVKKTEAQLTADSAQFDRVQDLVNKKALAGRMEDESRNRFESAQASKTSAQAALASARANVAVAQEKLAVAASDLDAAHAQTEVARKELEEMDALLAYATLKAPFAGIVTQRGVDPGDLVQNIQSASNVPDQPLLTIAALDKVRVRVSLPERDAGVTDPGDPASIVFRGTGDRTFTGKVNRVAGALDSATRTMLVEIDVDNPDGVLLPGMYGEATITLQEREDALVLPAGAVRYDESGRSFVYAVDAGGTVQVVDVATGLDDGNQIEIVSGLEEKARVVDSMIGRLQTGQTVRVKGE